VELGLEQILNSWDRAGLMEVGQSYGVVIAVVHLQTQLRCVLDFTRALGRVHLMIFLGGRCF
jgi:hypothetical protein